VVIGTISSQRFSGGHNLMASMSALIVEPILSDSLFLISIVSSLGFHLTVADNFPDAVERLRLMPSLLIADVRLGQYNGLHLVLRGKTARTKLAAIVTSAVDDPVLRSEAKQLGATFVVKPTTAEELRAAICRTVLRSADSAAEPIRPPFERRKVERRTVSAISYEADRRLEQRRRDVVRVIRQAEPM
jgi:DNA-binding response OmpR family regulator